MFQNSHSPIPVSPELVLMQCDCWDLIGFTLRLRYAKTAARILRLVAYTRAWVVVFRGAVLWNFFCFPGWVVHEKHYAWCKVGIRMRTWFGFAIMVPIELFYKTCFKVGFKWFFGVEVQPPHRSCCRCWKKLGWPQNIFEKSRTRLRRLQQVQ